MEIFNSRNGSGGFAGMLRQSDSHGVDRVPIREVFDAEFRVFGLAPSQQELTIARYENHVSTLTSAVSTKFPSGAKNADENALFNCLAVTFQRDLGATLVNSGTDTGQMSGFISNAIENRRFNCLSSTILMADTLGRMGKNISLGVAPTHVLIFGRERAFETAAHLSWPNIAPTFQQVNSTYRILQTISPTMLLGETHIWLAFHLGRSRQPEEALAELDMALSVNPKSAGAYNNKSTIFISKSLFDEALECADRALELCPNFTIALINKGFALMNLGRSNPGMECLDRAVAIDPESAKAYNDIGVRLAESNRAYLALVCYDKLLKIEPNNIAALNNKAEALIMEQDIKGSIKLSERVLKLEKNNARALKNKANALGILRRSW